MLTKHCLDIACFMPLKLWKTKERIKYRFCRWKLSRDPSTDLLITILIVIRIAADLRTEKRNLENSQIEYHPSISSPRGLKACASECGLRLTHSDIRFDTYKAAQNVKKRTIESFMLFNCFYSSDNVSLKRERENGSEFSIVFATIFLWRLREKMNLWCWAFTFL